MKFKLFLFCLISTQVLAQQVGDPDFRYAIESPLFDKGTGLKVAIDEGHNNFHTLSGRYASFGQLLSDDGFQMTSLEGEITNTKLASIQVLVISNPIHQSNLGNWVLPNPSAYSKAEVKVINEWVEKGGKLFLIADHMPFGGAAAELAESFGFNFTNGFVRFPEQNGFDTFSKEKSTIVSHSVTEGIDQVMTFTGQAFEIPERADGLLQFPKGAFSLEPDTAWRFNEDTYTREIEGWYQGALLEYGRGKVAVFGEAAMFTTQLAGAQKMKVGMNTRGAEQNAMLLRNVMRWLSQN
ncbi:hypothetical protein BFP97_17515 [Roseivirga sp. 4D4]|uniref:hypothetical protein n=1 Tax=Roseivirga sp. 4D4 TaxID=1889784 RepID=UPI00085315DE|nr:hypothetical protein [Roseivirga sp. 4D4]OEK03210.1 hypothetical protein BFP97_17515 [Roseivirga sp. 4D4]